MKKLLFVIAGIVLLGTLSAQAAQITTNVTSAQTVVLSTNRASVYSVEISSDRLVTVELFDQDSVAAPYYGTNYTTSAYPYRTSYATNYVTSYVGQNGWTNWYTNAGIWTLTLTNAAATNALSAAFSAGVSANTYVVYNTDLLFVNGVTLRVNTNANVILNYRPGN